MFDSSSYLSRVLDISTTNIWYEFDLKPGLYGGGTLCEIFLLLIGIYLLVYSRYCAVITTIFLMFGYMQRRS